MEMCQFLKKPLFKFHLLFAFVLLSSCQQKLSEPENPESEIAALWSNFTDSWNEMNSEGLMEIFAEDAKNIPPQFQVYSGSKEIQGFYDGLFNNHISTNYSHSIEELNFTENTAVEYGSFEVNWVRKDSIEWIFNARSITNWEKSEDGNWKIKYFIFNTLD